MIRIPKTLFFAAALGFGFTAAAGASSFQILEQSPSKLGTAFSGTASNITDASTVFYNPAGMSQLEGAQVTAGLTAIRPVAEFNDRGSVSAIGVPLSGPEGESDDVGVVPSIYYVQPISARWTFGLGVNAPFGLASSYDHDWIGRYHATDSELRVININPTFAFQLNEHLSVGFGANYQRLDAQLEKAVDAFAVCTGATGSAAGCSSGAFGTALVPALRAQDSYAVIEGDDAGWGVDLSLYYQFTEDTSAGLVYRQGVEFTIEGSADFDISSACAGNVACAGALQALSGPIEADVELPDTVTLSLSHQLTDQLAIHGDAAWTQWSTIQEVAIRNIENGATVSTLELDYDDTMRYAGGLTFAMSDAWTWRAGVAFDEAPLDSARLQTPRIPDGDRTWLTLGLNYAFSDTASLDVGYAHIWVDDIPVNNVEQGSLLKGEFDASVDIIGVSGNWRF